VHSSSLLLWIAREERFVTRVLSCRSKREKKSRRRLQKTSHGEAGIRQGVQPDLQARGWLMGAAGGRSAASAGGKGELGDR